MNPVKFPESNITLTGPLGMEDPDILPLPVYTDGKSCTSCYELTPDELAVIAVTGRLYITLWSGGSQPPIRLSTLSPFE